VKRIFFLPLIALLSMGSLQTGVAADDPLRPEKAFRYEVSGNQDDILVSWDIEPEYYLYKKRMSFEVTDPNITLGKPIFPQGEIHSDEFFGESEVYRIQADVRIPWSGYPSGPVELIIKSQGCADMGLCYPPQTWTTTVELPAARPPTKAAVPDFIKQELANEPLPGEEAFIVSTGVIDPFTVEIRWDIEPDYYIYKDQIQVSVLNGDMQAGRLQLPPGTEVDDIEYGLTEVYYGTVTARLPLSRGIREAQELQLELEFQGCLEDSICYPPQRSTLSLMLPEATTEAPDIELPETEQGELTRMIGSGNLGLVMLTFAGLGLLLAFTPCVLPMVPILSGIIAGQGENITTAKAFSLSLTYVLGMALTYTAAGVFFAAAGGQIQALLQQPWIIVGVAALFVALAFAMFGKWNLQLPASIQTRLNAVSSKQQAGTYLGTAVMGVLSALVVTTCVAPPLVATLTVIAETGDVVRGGASLFALSIGMGIPLLVIGTSAGKLLPKAGAWMDTVKELFGFMMLGLAIWMLERLLPGTVTMTMWGMLAIAAAIRVFLQLRKFSDNAAKTMGIIATGLLIYGGILLAAATQGGTNPLQPLRALTGETQHALDFKLIKSVTDLDRELETAAANDQFVMLDFYADWCVSCKEMEHYTFTDSGVQAALANAVLLQADVTANDAEDQALLARMGIFGPPTIIFFGPDGKEIENQRVIGFMSAESFREHIGRLQSSSQVSK